MKKINKNYKFEYIIIVLISILLYLRDVQSFGISKAIFIILIIPALLFMPKNKAIILWVFLMPLYVGLPGNYITLVMLLKFLTIRNIQGKVKIHKMQIALTTLLAIFILIQNIYYNYFEIYYMIFIVELFVVYFFITTEVNGCFTDIILSYTLGVALTGIIMLAYTLKTYDFSELLSVATRLGYVGRTNAMSVIVDPNYYGLFSITAITCNWLLISKKMYNFGQKIVGMTASIVSGIIALIGMSLAFVVCLVLFIFLSVLFAKKISAKMKMICIGILGICVIFWIIPDTVNVIIERFNSADMQTGNGRSIILENMLKQWENSVGTILFGIGLFNCSVHFMQMQYLIGCGIVGALLIGSLGISYFIYLKKRIIKFEWISIIPIILVQISAASIPTAQSLTFMMPVVMSLVVFGGVNKSSIKIFKAEE